MKILKMTVGALCLLATSATAAPVKWTIDFTISTWDVQGSFVYDKDTDETSDIMITASYDFSASGGAVGTSMLDTLLSRTSDAFLIDYFVFGSSKADETGEARVDFQTARGSLLTNAGGSLPLAFLGTYSCRNATCTSFQGGTATNPANPLVGVPLPAVPLPSSIPMLLSALGLLGWRARRRRGAALAIPS